MRYQIVVKNIESEARAVLLSVLVETAFAVFKTVLNKHYAVVVEEYNPDAVAT